MARFGRGFPSHYVIRKQPAAARVAILVSGVQPAASGSLTRKLRALRSVAGAQPAATGGLTRKLQAKRIIAGVQPSASGSLTARLIFQRSVAGTQPAASGTLTRKLQAKRAVTGVQPAASGTLTRKLQAERTLTGVQPAASAPLTTVLTPAPAPPPPVVVQSFPVVPWYPIRLTKPLTSVIAIQIHFVFTPHGVLDSTGASAVALRANLAALATVAVHAHQQVVLRAGLEMQGHVILSPQRLEELEELELLGL